MSLNPNGAPPGYYYQAGATAYIVDPPGTYSGAGQSAPTADPAGTYSAAGASKPTEDPAGTYSSPYALDRLFLDTSVASPLHGVLSFNSATAVANFYGATSFEATLANQFFAGYGGSSATMLFTRYPVAGARAHLAGSNVSNLTLNQLQSINGTLSITSQGYAYSGTINLSGVQSFSSAAVEIQAALNQNLPVAAVTTGSSIAPASVSFKGSINGLLLQVTSISSGSMYAGAIISGPRIPAGTQINSQIEGTPGGVGLYSLYVPGGTVSSEMMTESYGVLTVGSASSGAVAAGQQVTGAGVLPLTAIEGNLSGSGAGSTWLVNNAQTVGSENMTMTGAPLSVIYTAIAGATANRAHFEVQQNGNFNFGSSSLTYMGGTAAGALGLMQASGALLSSPGGIAPSASAFMNNLIQTESSQFGSVENMWPGLAQEAPDTQAPLAAWAQSTDGQYNFLAANSAVGNTPPAGSSAPTTDPAGTYSGRGASAPTLAAPGTYIPITGATSAAAEIVDPAGTYSGAGASAPTTDPAGTYSGRGASAPTLAAPGTYIPITGATSAAAQIVDPAGSYSLAGASAPTTDPAGTYSGRGVSAPTLAAPGTYIPITRAKSAAAQIIDPAGSYSLAGASAPILAQPGYYVPTTGASSETPDSPGYYTPYPGATTEFLAQTPTISGTVAGQTTSGPDTPFSSVTLTDPNIDTSDTLSIQLTNGGGTLADGVGFDGLTLSAPGVYILSGTAAAITSELDALVFTPSGYPATTTLTLTNSSSAGTSAVDSKTTVTDSSSGPIAVSVSTFLANQSTLDQTPGGFKILDGAGAITASLDQLDDPNIDAILIVDNGQVTASVQQLTTDATAIGKLQNANSSPVLLAINDTAADVQAGLSTLVANTGEIASITASNGPVVVSTSTFLADQPTLDKIVGGFAISDTASDVAQDLDALNADTNVMSIALTDEGVPTLTVSIQQAMNDTRALNEIPSPHATLIADTAAATITSTQAIYLSGENIAVDGAPVIATGTVATMAILAQIVTSLLESQGYTLAVLDTAANIQGLTKAQIANLSARNVLLLQASDTSVALSATLAASLEGADMKVSAPPGDTVQISDTAAHLEGLTASQISDLTATGVTGLVSTNANVSYSPTQTAAILSSGLNVSASDSYTVTENFANGNYSVYQGGQLIQQKSVNPDGSYDVAYFDVTGQTYSSYEDIYNAAGTLVADAQENVNGSGNLLLDANGLTITSSSGSESVTVGSDTFAINPHSIETTTATNMQSETFVYGLGFGQDTLIGFLETSASHDLLQFSASMFGFSSPSSQSQQTADAQALLSNHASGRTNTTITDLQGDTLTINHHAISTFQNNLQDFKFT